MKNYHSVIFISLGLLFSVSKMTAQVTLGIIDTTTDSTVASWIRDIMTPGISVQNDTIIFSEEVNRILADTAYKNQIFPESYSWQGVMKFIKNQEIKPAFWYAINLYSNSPKDKELALKTVLAYDNMFKMEVALPAVFGTYSLLDPEIGEVKDGHSEITAPHILEKKLTVVKEMLYYVAKNRELKKKKE